MGPEFFQTPMGQRFYQVTVPRIADGLIELNKNLAALIALLRERLPAAPAMPTGRPPEGG